ncbi:MAG: hypothetical protein L3K26_05295, partial [Candidatus Hydrogenedentes bacterium]|nr:hypothetical protein [Candidatus Hydrogenedentota bacterium]
TVFAGWMKGNSGAWPYHPFNVANGGHLTTYPEAGVTIDTPGTEVWQENWSEAWSKPRKTQWIWERFAKKAIDDLGSLGNVFFVFYDEHSYTEGNMGDHFADFFQSRGQVWMDWGKRRDRVDMVYDQHLLTKGDDRRLAAQFTKSPIRPFFGLEEGGTSGFNYTADLLHTLWRFMMAGGHYLHHDDERQESVTTGIMVYDPSTTPSGAKDKVLERRRWRGNASRFFNEDVGDRDAMAPHNDVSGPGVFCFANPGREYVLYAPKGSPEEFIIDLGAAGTVECRFYDPRTGKYGAAFTREGGVIQKFVKPDSRAWVLHLRVQGK